MVPRNHVKHLLRQETLLVGVSKLGAIAASNFLDLHIKLILGPSCRFLECFLYFTFVMQKEHPSEARKIINNNKAILVTANANVGHGSK